MPSIYGHNNVRKHTSCNYTETVIEIKEKVELLLIGKNPKFLLISKWM